MDLEHDMTGNVDAFEQTLRATIELAEGFTADDWTLPTECPGWTVKDQISHLVGVERMSLGDPQPSVELPDDLDHVRHDFARMLEVQVQARRDVPGPEILDELRETLERRLVALKEIDPELQMPCPDGKVGPYSRFMMFRAFDCWTHEQDIRRAVGKPGNLDAPAAARARHVLSSGLPYVVGKKAHARPGQAVTLKISGPPSYRSSVTVGDDGRGRAVAEVAEPTVTLELSWESYVRLAAGRCGPDAVEVTVAGDADLPERVLTNMTVTP